MEDFGTLFGLSGIGDVGWSNEGGTSLNSLQPDMQKKVGAMMRANPRLRMRSGLRDTAMQGRLKAGGYANVSGKASAHTRGQAADLGPASEYGWIAANAGKFGLKSGKSHGEPWHVGIGDTDSPWGFLGGLMEESGFDNILARRLAWWGRCGSKRWQLLLLGGGSRYRGRSKGSVSSRLPRQRTRADAGHRWTRVPVGRQCSPLRQEPQGCVLR